MNNDAAFLLIFSAEIVTHKIILVGCLLAQHACTTCLHNMLAQHVLPNCDGWTNRAPK
jgi:hypothetical protein